MEKTKERENGIFKEDDGVLILKDAKRSLMLGEHFGKPYVRIFDLESDDNLYIFLSDPQKQAMLDWFQSH